MSTTIVASERHYARFLSPGTFVAEITRKPIESRDDLKAVCELAKSITERHNAKPYGFTLDTYEELPPIPDGKGGEFKVEPRFVKSSGVHYLGGYLERWEEVFARKKKEEDILRSNMRGNDIAVLVVNQNSYKHTSAFEKDDLLIDPETGEILRRGDEPELLAAYETLAAQKALGLEA
jgi:hypothetical protein